ncbi:MAG: polysaccharide biosynthesis tyrosine autokinase [Candidatus Omnitrophica bacterium]|nr:polysaccharide biosynthesis tyrosine autokinase [Candidatus Omnitrophota bacterium]
MNIGNIEQELNFKDYISVIRRRRGLILLFFVTTVFVVTVGSFVMPHVYRATVTLLIDSEGPNILTASDGVALESQGYYTYKEYYKSQTEIIASRSIARRVFEEFNLAKSQQYANSKDPVGQFLKSVTVEPVRDTRLLRLHVDNKNPVLAAKLANRMAEIYVKQNLYYISREEIMNLLKNEYLKLEAKMSEYSKIYKAKHPSMIRLKEEMQEMAKRIEHVKESTSDRSISEKDIQGEDVKYALEGLKANNVSIQDPAEVPVKPIKPKKRLNVLLSMIVGLFGGVGLAFFLEYIDDTVKSLDDLEHISDWPFLGSVPDIDNAGKVAEVDKDLLTNKRPKDPIAEAYRAIRTSILFSSTEEHPLYCMLVTSPGPQEGKTTTLCNIVLAISQGEKRVLIVDADMRKPRLHVVFKKENERGLSDFLSAQAQFNDVVQKTDIANVSLVTGGKYPPNPSELLSSHKVKEFIKIAKEKFDFVLFDTPPIAVVTDAAVLSQAVDGVIMVIESEKTSKRVLPRIFRLLRDAKARIVGIVLNKISLKVRDYNYYYHTHYYGKNK